MMIDFVKFGYQNGWFMRDHPLLDFKQEISIKTGTKRNYEKAQYKKMDFILYESSGYLQIQGSIHKYYHHDNCNYDDYSYSEINDTIQDLSNTFSLDPKLCKMKNIETGVNLTTSTNPTVTYLDNVMLHGLTKFDSSHNGNCKHADHNSYKVKIYNKGLESKLQDSNILRYELHFNKIRALNNIPIRTLSDLLQPHWIEPSATRLIKEWDKVRLFDHTLNTSHVSPLDLANWKNPNYWLSLSRDKRYKENIKYNNSLQLASNQTHLATGNQILNKFYELAGS